MSVAHFRALTVDHYTRKLSRVSQVKLSNSVLDRVVFESFKYFTRRSLDDQASHLPASVAVDCLLRE